MLDGWAVWLLIGLAGGLGAVCRFACARVLQPRRGRGFPYAILVVNTVGSFALGLIASLAGQGALRPEAAQILSVGAVSAFTTYSTFNEETLVLWSDRSHGLAALNVAATLLGCGVLGALGHAVGTW